MIYLLINHKIWSYNGYYKIIISANQKTNPISENLIEVVTKTDYYLIEVVTKAGLTVT
jgi:hypothetical protein